MILAARNLFVQLGTAALLYVLLAIGALAQTPEPIDYDAFEELAARAETVLERGEASNAILGDIRTRLTDWRTRLLEAENTNASRIQTLQGQIDALGPEPDTEAGETEPEEIAARRQQLNDQLAAAELPRVNALEAYNRSDGLIGEIDRLIRARENEALLERGATPLNPASWPAALNALTDVYGLVRQEISDNLASPLQRETLLGSAPVIIGMLALAILLLVRGPVWTARLTDRIQKRRRKRGRATIAFFVSLSQILLPVAGTMLFVVAFLSTGIAGETGTKLFGSLIGFLATSFTALWLGGRLFPEDDDQPAAFDIPAESRAAARRTLVGIGVLAGLSLVNATFVDLDQVPPSAAGVFLLPFYIILGLLFWRLSQIIASARRSIAESTEDFTPSFSGRLLGLLRRVLTVIAVVGPVLAAAGYVNAAEALMVPTALSLGLIALLIALHVPVRDLYALLSNTPLDQAGDALIPVLVNFVLAFASLPFFALVWGMRTTELFEIYARFAEGFSIGESRITPGTILTVLLVFLVALGATRLLQSALKSTVLPRTKMDVGAQNAITSGLGYFGIAIAVLLAINAGGIDLTALAFILSALSVGIGFGLQNVVQNFVSGIILLIERPISEGDWIEVGPNMGIVKDISVRSTTIETFDKQQVIVPNGDFISGTVTNWTRGSPLGRAVVTVGVAYGTDTRRVEELLLDIVRDHPDVMSYPAVEVDFLGFGADSLDFRIRAMLYDVNNLLHVKTEIHHRIAERFANEGIEIPFAQRDVWLRNPESLQSASAPSGPDTTNPVPDRKGTAASLEEVSDGDIA